MSAPGLEELNDMRASGFSEAEIQNRKAEIAEDMRTSGFTYPEIDAHFGIVEPDVSKTKAQLEANLKAYRETPKPTGTPAPSGTPAPAGVPEVPINPELQTADSMIEAFEAGWQTSVSGLVKRQKLPEMLVPEDADLMDKLAMAAGQMIGDVPAMIPGAIAGAEVGGTAGAVTGGLAGAPFGGVGAIPGAALGGFVGATVGGGAGAFAAPAMMRKALMDHYEKGDIKDPADFLARTNAVLLEGAKGGVIGGVTALAGPMAGIAAKGAAPIISKSAAVSAELVTMTAITSAVEKELPKFDDFAINAIVLGAMHGTTYTAKKLQNIYRETGVKPEMVTEAAKEDPVLLGEVLSDRANFEVPTEFKNFVEVPKEAPGKLAPVYHGTAAKFEKPDFSKSGGMVFFGESKEVARRYAEGAGGGRDAARDSQKYVVNNDGIVFELQGAKSVEKTHRMANGKELKYTSEEGGQWVAIGKHTGDGLVNEGITPLKKEVPPMSRADAESLIKDQYGTVVPKDARILEQNIDMNRVLDATTPEGLNKLKEVLNPTNPTIKMFLKEIDAETSGKTPDQGFNNAFWTTTKNASRAETTNAHLHEFSQQLKDAGFVGIRFIDDAHKTIAAFDNFQDPAPAAPPKLIRVQIPGEGGEFVFRTREQKPVEAPKAEAPAAPPADDPVSQARAKIREKVASAPEHKKDAYDMDRFIEDMIDYRHPLKRLDEAFNGGKLSPELIEESTYALSRMFSGLEGKLDAWMKYGPVDFKTGERTGTRGLGTILKEMGEDLRAQGRDYAISMRVLELDKRGIKHPFDSAAAKVIAKNTSKEVKAYHQEILDFRNEQTKYLVDSGLMDKKTAEKMFKESVNYTPFYRLQEEAPSSGAGEMRSSKNPIKKMKGSEEGVVLDPYESLVRDLGVMVKMAEKNKVLKAIGDLALKDPERAKDIGLEKVETQQKAIKVTDKEVAKWMEENGIEGDAAEMMIFRKADKALGEDQIAFYRDGKREVYRVPKDVKRALDNMDPQEANVFLKVLGSTTKAMKMGVTMTPEFMIKNPIRDNISAMVVSRNGYNPFHFVRGLKEIMTDGEAYQSWLYEGGGNASFNTFDSKSLTLDFAKLDKETGFISKGWNVVKKPAEAMHAAAQLLENSTRVGEFIAAKGKGRSNMSAAYESRDLIDFHRMGAKGRSLNQIIAFWNVNVQGKNRLYTAFKEDPKGTTARIVATTVLPTVGLWWANKDDPRVNEAANYVRDNFFLIPMDSWVDVDPKNPPPLGSHTRELNGKTQVNEGVVLRIPMSQDVAPIGAMIWRTLDAYYKENPMAFEDFGKTLGGAAGFDFMPNAFLPVVEHITNHSMFTDRPLVSPGMEKVLPHLRYNAYSSETAKMLSRFVGAIPGGNSLDLSPPVLENYIRQWSGTWGMYAVQAADKALIESNAVTDPVKPTPTWSDTPFFKAFVVRYPSASAQSIQNFRAEYQRTSQIVASIKLQIDRGEINDAISMQKAALAEGELLRLEGTQRALTQLSQYAQSISDNKQMSPDEKRQILDSTFYLMMSQAQTANKALVEMRKALKK